MTEEGPIHEIEVAAVADPPDGVRLEWRCGGDSFLRRVEARRAAALTAAQEGLYQRMAQGHPVAEEISALGAEMGDLLVGEENVAALRGFLERRDGRFALCRIGGGAGPLPALPWEALQLPGTSEPLLFAAEARGWFDFARDHPPGLATGGRRVLDKCLASISPHGELMVQKEVEELSRRFLRHPIRFRWVLDPDLSELIGRLRLECTLFLFAGHGWREDDSYKIGLRSGAVDVRTLHESLRLSRAEMLIFDSCDSGGGDPQAGLPALLGELPSATCLLGLQGPTDDTLACWHMPEIIERLLIGEPVWSCVNLLRMMLYEQGADTWFAPVMHLKRTYQPFENARGTRDYLDGLSDWVDERRSGGDGSRTAGSPRIT